MQADPALVGLLREVKILGVNGVGQENGNATACAGRVIPWIQDVVTANVWALWAVNYRDVVILDAQNEPIAVYNLTVNDLQIPANYAALLNLLVQAASAP